MRKGSSTLKVKQRIGLLVFIFAQLALCGCSQSRTLTTAGLISTLAGKGKWGFSGDGGLATAARLLLPTGVAVDFADNLYIAETGNNRIRRITAAGIISTVVGNGTRGFSGDGDLATAAQMNGPGGVALDSEGNLYIADFFNSRIRKITREPG
jgi:trimeric autotransporter adhesin